MLDLDPRVTGIRSLLEDIVQEGPKSIQNSFAAPGWDTHVAGHEDRHHSAPVWAAAKRLPAETDEYAVKMLQGQTHPATEITIDVDRAIKEKRAAATGVDWRSLPVDQSHWHDFHAAHRSGAIPLDKRGWRKVDYHMAGDRAKEAGHEKAGEVMSLIANHRFIHESVEDGMKWGQFAALCEAVRDPRVARIMDLLEEGNRLLPQQHPLNTPYQVNGHWRMNIVTSGGDHTNVPARAPGRRADDSPGAYTTAIPTHQPVDPPAGAGENEVFTVNGAQYHRNVGGQGVPVGQSGSKVNSRYRSTHPSAAKEHEREEAVRKYAERQRQEIKITIDASDAAEKNQALADAENYNKELEAQKPLLNPGVLGELYAFSHLKGEQLAYKIQRRRGIPHDRARRTSRVLSVLDHFMGMATVAAAITAIPKIGVDAAVMTARAAVIPFASLAYVMMSPVLSLLHRRNRKITPLHIANSSGEIVREVVGRMRPERETERRIANFGKKNSAYGTRYRATRAPADTGERGRQGQPRKFNIGDKVLGGKITGYSGGKNEVEFPDGRKSRINSTDLAKKQAAYDLDQEEREHKEKFRKEGESHESVEAQDDPRVDGIRDLLEWDPRVEAIAELLENEDASLRRDLKTLSPHDADMVIEAMESYPDDWFGTLLVNAGGTLGEIAQAIRVAEAAYKEHPRPPGMEEETSEAVDERVLAIRELLESPATYVFTTRPALPEELGEDFVIDAHHNGKNVGFLTVSGVRGKNKDGGDDVLFRNLNVQGEHRGQGVAHELLRRGVERFGDRRIELKAAPYQDEPLSQEQLMALYGKHGFVRAPGNGYGRMVRSPETQESVDPRVAGIRELLEEVLKEPCPSCGRRMLRKSPGGKVFCPAAYCEYHR